MNDELQLPELNDEIEKNDRKDWLRELQSFTAFLNKSVDPSELKAHHLVKGAKYLPISRVEMRLDTLFFGLWKTENFRWEVIENEVAASIDVSVYHPFAKMWITRTGAMATQILVNVPDDIKKDYEKKNAWSVDIKHKKPSALMMGMFSSLKADCFKNACLSLGKTFGRDVNRDETAEYHALIKGTGDNRELIDFRQKLSEAIQHCQVEELKKEIIDKITEEEDGGMASAEFYTRQLEKLQK